MKIAGNCVVTFHYRLSDADGKALEDSFDGDPMAYLHGHGGIIPGLEREMKGREAGATFNATIPPAMAYGERREDAVQRIQKKAVMTKGRVKPGMVISVSTDQGPRQVTAFNAISRLIEDLETSPYYDTGDTWLDHTTIVVFSEFQRGALINAGGGRDHSLTNACILAGAGIEGGQIIGRSSDIGMEPTPMDLATGQWSPEGEIVKPEHIIQTLMTDIGMEGDPADLRVDPVTALLKA